MSKIDESLFSVHEHALDKAYHVCPKCGGELTLKNSKAGAFWGCSQYPECNFTRPTQEHQTGILKEFEDKPCPDCGNNLALKKGRYGMFVGCTNFPNCQHMESLEQADDTQVGCPKCKKGHLMQRTSRYGKTFYACNNYPQCKFAVNNPPVTGNCSLCDFPLLITKKRSEEERLFCASKKCGKIQPKD